MHQYNIVECGSAGDLDFPDAFYEKSVEILSRYISVKTVNPPGNEKAGVEFLQYILDQNGLASKIYETAPGRFGLACRISGTEPDFGPIVLANHIDVVPADENQWEVPPFSGTIKDGYIWGRGALDMKGMGIMELMAILAIHKRRDPIKRGIIFLALPDEERAGQHGAAVFAEKHLNDMNPALVINEGGFGLKGMMFDGIVFPIDVTEKLQMKLKLTATGRGGHGNQPLRDTAITRLISALSKIAAHKFPFRLHPVVRESFQRLAEKKKFPESLILKHCNKYPFSTILSHQFARDKTLNALTRNTISITVLQSGSAPNLIPATAEAILDVRMLPGEDPQRIIAELKRIVRKEKVEIQILSAPLPGPVTSHETKPFTLWEEILLEAFPESLVVPLMDIGGSDSKHFRARDIPCYGLMPVVIDQDEMGGVHGKNERLSIDNLRQGIKILYRYVVKICNLDDPLYADAENN
jgi:acetylornithine deacetylase/succinyl-diaminopimelate desuccinylase-like protein